MGSTTSSNVQPAKLAVSDKQVMKIDEILKKSGGFAKYQVRVSLELLDLQNFSLYNIDCILFQEIRLERPNPEIKVSPFG